jgi:hypothetical protein
VSLYAISTEMQSIIDAMLDGGIDSPEAMAAMDEHLQGLDIALESKAENYAGVIRELELRAAARTEEAKRIRTLAEADSTLATRLKERLRDAMVAVGKTRIETERFRLSVQANGGQQPLVIDPGAVDELPAALTRIVREPDKAAIRAALESGDDIPGCTLLPRGSSLRIK